MCQDTLLEPDVQAAAIRPLRWLLDPPGSGAKAEMREVPGLLGDLTGCITEVGHPCPEAAAHTGASSLHSVLGSLAEGNQIPARIHSTFWGFLGQFLEGFAEVSQPLVPPCAPAMRHMPVCWLRYRPTDPSLCWGC